MCNARVILGGLVIGLCSCSHPQQSEIVNIVDLPLKSTRLPSLDWANAPLRAQAQYILYGANSETEKQERLGDYYFVTWYDAAPEKAVKLLMSYTQSATGSKVLQRELVFDKGREKVGERKAYFFFKGAERAKRGDILSWRMSLYEGRQLIDSKQSYLWVE